MGGSLQIAPEATYSLLALFAAYISFTVVRFSINFGFYFFFITRAASKTNNAGFLEAQSAGRRFSFKTLVRLIYLNFFAPAIIAFLFTQELTGAVVVEALGIDQATWEVSRLGLVLLFMLLRYQTFREELQF